ncbi:hypothetical protein [Profundibacter sp.]
MSICPQNRFSTIRYGLVKAAEAKRIIDTSWHQSHKDQAIKDYTRAVDRIMAELNALAEAGVLDDLAEFMAVTYGRPE